MAQLTLEIPDDLARGLEGIATAQQKSVEQVALDRLRSLVAPSGSPTDILRAMKAEPRLSPEAVDELEEAIRTGRLPS